jgi:hypothetical protein
MFFSGRVDVLTGLKIVFVFTCLFAFAGCEVVDGLLGRAPAPVEPLPPPPVRAARPAVFTPPEDSAVTPRQFALWKEANSFLDSLAYFYADSFSTDDPAQALRVQEDFMKAQDMISRRTGLAGYAEYVWVSQNLGLPRNRPLFEDSAQ